MLKDIFVDPILNIFIWLTAVVPGQLALISILIITVVIRLLFWPLASRQHKAQAKMHELQPKVDEIHHKYSDHVKRSQKITEFYSKNGVKPIRDALYGLVQLPILVAVLFALDVNISTILSDLYSWTIDAVRSNGLNLGRVNLVGSIDAFRPNILMSILAGASQLTYGFSARNAGGKFTQLILLAGLPIFITVISLYFTSTVAAYWILNNLLLAGQARLNLRSGSKVS